MISRHPLHREDFRFELRPYDFSCVFGLFDAAVTSTKEICPWMAWMHDRYQLRDMEEWVDRCIKTWDEQREFEFVIYDREDGAPVGSCGLNNINRKDRVCNLGYWVGTSKSRLGAATQAALLIKDFGLKVLKLNRLEIVVAEGNTASRRVAEKAQAVYEGIQRRRVMVGDKIHDAHMYALI